MTDEELRRAFGEELRAIVEMRRASLREPDLKKRRAMLRAIVRRKRAALAMAQDEYRARATQRPDANRTSEG